MYRLLYVHSQSEAGACLMPEPSDPEQACVPGAVVGGQPTHLMPLIVTQLDRRGSSRTWQ